MKLYREILKQSAIITWKSKIFWFFGIFAALLGNGGEYGILSGAFSGNFEQNMFPLLNKIMQAGIFSIDGIKNIAHLMIKDPGAVFAGLIVLSIVFLIAGFVIWLSNVSQAALVNNSLQKLSNKDNDFHDGLIAGARKFWSVFGLNMLLRVIIFLTFFIISGIAVYSQSNLSFLAAGLLYSLLFLIFIPLTLSASFVVKYGICYNVIQNLNFIESLKSGCRLFRKNWLVSLEMAFILYGINVILVLVAMIVLLILATPFAFLAFLAAALSMSGMLWFIVAVGAMFLFSLLIFSGGVLSTFQISAWTHLYIELIGRGGKSKLVRMFTK